MRILVTGPECSGKSTLSQQLSYKLSIPWFPEYARTFLEEYGPDYEQSDVLHIAKEHEKLYSIFPEDQPLVLDTYLLNLKIWTEYKYNKPEPWIDSQLNNIAPFDFVFLMKPDLPWIADGLRESEDKREDLFKLYHQELTKLTWNYQVIEGKDNERIEAALAFLSV